MSLILAIDTSAKPVSCALIQEDKILAAYYSNTGLTHSQTLLPMVEHVLHTADVTVDALDAVAVNAGPGSFTGVRIGVAAAKGFAWGSEIPCHGVSTLEAMALGLGVYDGCICACMDARRAQVYNAIFRAEKGVLTRISQDRAIALADLKTELERIDGPITLVGDGAALTHKTLNDLDLILPPEFKQHQRAVGVGLAALAAINRGETGDAAALAPNYLRLSQAERERLEKEKGEK